MTLNLYISFVILFLFQKLILNANAGCTSLRLLPTTTGVMM